MSANEMSMFFFVLGAFGVTMVVVGILLALMRVVGGPLSGTPAHLVDAIRPHATLLAFVAATTAMLGSLYYSEIAGFVPCRMCWYQRFAMYPASILLGLALATRKSFFTALALALSVVGIGLSTYHRLEQQFPNRFSSNCTLDAPCSGRFVNLFGFVTIPTMAWVGFAFVIMFTLLALVSGRGDAKSVATDADK